MPVSTAQHGNAARPTPPADEWTNSTKQHMVPTQFGNVCVRTGGNAHGPVMVFWPSLLMDSSMWSHQLRHYAPNYTIVLLDPPGIGQSDALRRTIDVEQSAACLCEILDSLNVKTCILVGSSWGSLVALVFAARNADRLTAAIITNGTAAPPTPEVTARMSELVGNLEKCTTAPDWLLPATQGAFAGPTAEASKPEFMAYLGRVLQEDPVSIAYAMKGILLGRKDLHPTARLIQSVPVLIIAGEEDRFFAVSEGKSLAAAIAGSQFVVLPKTGHLSPRESPEAVNAEIDKFLTKTAAKE